MTEPGTESTAEPSRQIDRQLLAESKLYGVQYAAYAVLTPRERGAVKGRWAHKLRSEAKRRRIDPDEFLAMTEDARAEARKEYPERSPVKAAAQKKPPSPDTAAAFAALARKHGEP